MEKPNQHQMKDVESGHENNHLSHWQVLTQQGAVTPSVQNYKYEGSGTEDDPYLAEWIPNDPRDPLQWTSLKRWVMAVTMALATLVVAFCSSAYSGGIPTIIREFHVSQEVATLGITLFVLGFAFGPLIWAPFSEIWGRQVVFLFTFFGLVLFNAAATGAKNIWTLLIFRFLGGAFGSAPLSNAGGVVADLFNAKDRGLAMSVFSVAPFMGPVLGPIISGFLGQARGWVWVEGFMAIFSGAVFFIAVFIVPETYAPALLRKRAETLSKQTGKVYYTRMDVDQGRKQFGEVFATGLKRPWILLFTEPIVLLLSLYMAIVYGTLYMLFGAFPIVYRIGRGWNQGVAGLPFIGVAIGMMIALAYTLLYDNKRYVRCVENSPDGFATPEDRLPSSILGGIALPIGLFWFAWTNYPEFPWAASVAAAIPFGFGMVCIFLSVMNYLIDSYTIYAASTLAGNGILRAMFGAVFPLFTVQMFNGIGIHWASTVPAFLSLACLPFPFLFYKYGAAIRKKCKYANESEMFMQKMRARAVQQKQQAENPASESSRTTSINKE